MINLGTVIRDIPRNLARADFLVGLGIKRARLHAGIELDRSAALRDAALGHKLTTGEPPIDVVMLHSQGESFHKPWRRHHLSEEVAALGGRLRTVPVEQHRSLLEHRPDIVFARTKNPRAIAELEKAGIPVINSGSAIATAGSKAKSAEQFRQGNVPIPETGVATSLEELRAHAQDFGFPLVAKTEVGAGGTGVFFPKNDAELQQIARDHLQHGRRLVTQRFYDVGGRDQRMVVAPGADGTPELIAVVERRSRGTDPRANGGTRGTVARRLSPDPADGDITVQERDMALDAVTATGLRFGAVDEMRTTERGTLVIEANSSPTPPELDVDLPRAEQLIPRLAQDLVNQGRAARAARPTPHS